LLEAHIQVVAEGTAAAAWDQQNKCPLGNIKTRCKQTGDSVGLQVNRKQRWRVLVDWNRYSGVDGRSEVVELDIDWAGENLFE